MIPIAQFGRVQNVAATGAAAIVPPSISYRTSAADATDASSYTFSAQDIGTAGSNRHVIIVAIGMDGALGSPTVTSCTIGGVTATLTKTQNSGDGGHVSILITAVPTGATGDIVVNMSVTMARLSIGVWAAYDLASITAVTTAGSVANPASLNMNTQIGDVMVAGGFSNTGSTMTWTGVIERFDAENEGAMYTGGDHTATTAETPRTIEGAYSASSRVAAAAALWR